MDKILINHITPTLRYADYPDVLSVNDVAALLQIGRNSAYKLVHSGKICSVRIGKTHKISKKSLVDFMEGKQSSSF